MVGLMGLCGGDGEVVNAMGQWIVDAMGFQKINGLNTAECHTVEKWSGRLGLVGLMGLCG